ncbi:MAG: DUF4170 domain-containing protein [Roseiarcus sp.]|jgi:hypothetical protein
MTHDEASTHEPPPFLHLVLVAELKGVESRQFRDPAKIDVGGVSLDCDSAQTRHFIVHLHRFLEPKGLKRKPA